MCSYLAVDGRQDHGCEQGMYHGVVALGVWILPIGLEKIGLSGGGVAVLFEWVRVFVWCRGCQRVVCMVSCHNGGDQ